MNICLGKLDKNTHRSPPLPSNYYAQPDLVVPPSAIGPCQYNDKRSAHQQHVNRTSVANQAALYPEAKWDCQRKLAKNGNHIERRFSTAPAYRCIIVTLVTPWLLP